MTNQGSTLLAVHLDRSSRLRPLLPALRSGLADLLDAQAAQPGSLQVVLSTGDPAVSGSPADAAAARAALPPALRPRRGTDLPTATGPLLDAVGAELAGRDEQDRPERVVVLLAGEAGRGTDADVAALRERIEHQRSTYAWEFVLVDVLPAAAGGTAPAGDGPADRQAPGDVARGESTADSGAESPDQDPAAGASHGTAEGAAHGITEGAARGTAEGVSGTAVALAERPQAPAAAARYGVPVTATLTAGPGAAGVTAAMASASAFVGRARTVRPYEPVEGFTDDDRAAAAAPDARPGWRRLLRLP